MATTAREAWQDFVSGLGMPLGGLRLILAHRELLLLAVLPAALAVVTAGATTVAMVSRGDQLLQMVWARPQACLDCQALPLVWSALAVAAWEAAHVALILFVPMLAALVVARGLAAPVMALLGLRGLRALDIRDSSPMPPIFMLIWQTVTQAVFRALLLIGGYVALWMLLLLPGGAVVSSPLTVVWTVVWLFADSVEYPLQWIASDSLAAMKQMVRSRPWIALGFAVSVGGLMLLPVAGLATTPLAVTGACIYVARVHRELPRAAGALAASVG